MHQELSSNVIPETFNRRMEEVFGAQGTEWAAELPNTLQNVARDWELQIRKPVPNLTYHFVAYAEHRGEDVVLKLGVPREDLDLEIAALGAFASEGAVRLIRHDRERGAMLLERLRPGTMLHEHGTDEEQTRAAAVIMKTLPKHPSAGHRFPTLQHWLRAFDNPHSAPITDLIARVRPHAEELIRKTEDPMLLHGDLHHENILLGGKGWVAIDPQGVIADRSFEVGTFLRNKIDDNDLEGQLSRRLKVFSYELQQPERELARWAYVNMALSMSWDFQEEEASLDERTMRVAKALERLYQL